MYLITEIGGRDYIWLQQVMFGVFPEVFLWGKIHTKLTFYKNPKNPLILPRQYIPGIHGKSTYPPPNKALLTLVPSLLFHRDPPPDLNARALAPVSREPSTSTKPRRFFQKKNDERTGLPDRWGSKWLYIYIYYMYISIYREKMRKPWKTMNNLVFFFG